MTEEMRLMRETIDSQHVEICNLNRNAEALRQEIRSLKKENEKLREQLAKYLTRIQATAVHLLQRKA